MNFKNIPPVTLNLLIINCVVLLLQDVLMRMGIDLNATFGLNFFLADNFRIWQLFTYMFMHGGLMHLFFNMFALWMFGMVIERALGTKRFLIYDLFCGVGAGICQELWQFGEFYFTGMMAYDNVNLSGTIIPMEMFRFRSAIPRTAHHATHTAHPHEGEVFRHCLRCHRAFLSIQL